MRYSILTILLFTVLLINSTSAWSAELPVILKAKQPPEGIVFEIVSDEPGLLKKLLPSIKENIIRLRDRFPDLPIAIVTHGKEQFDLTIKNQGSEVKTHQMLRKMVNEDGIDLHVCATHAEWYGVMPEEFPDFVDVSAEGPAQIDDYEAIGYEVIILTE